MGNWGTTYADRNNMPNWLTAAQKDGCILSTKGWELRAPGNGNPLAMREVLVAFNAAGVTGGDNEAPVFWTSLGADIDRFEPLVGISGVAITPFVMEVFDLEQTHANGLATSAWHWTATGGVAAVGLPAGLAMSTSGDYVFTITGTVAGATAGVIGITFTDGSTLAHTTFGVSITA